MMVVELPAHELQSDLMRQFHHRCVFGDIEDRILSLTAVEGTFARRKTELQPQFCLLEIILCYDCPVRLELVVVQRACFLVLLIAYPRGERQAVEPLFLVLQHTLADILHFRNRLTHFPSHEHVILAGEKEILTGRIEIILLDEGKVVHWAFSLVILLFVEAVGQLGVVLDPSVVDTVGHVAAGEPIRMEIGSGHTTHTHTKSLHLIDRKSRIHRTKIEFAEILVLLSGDIARNQDLGSLDHGVEHRHLA